MGARSGIALKALQWSIRAIQFLCSALVLAVYSYFLATLRNHDLNITKSMRAVEGISGAATLYTLVGLVLLCCLAGLTFSAVIAIILDVAFIGAFVYVAVANKNGASSCSGYLDTPFGKGQDTKMAEGGDGFTPLPSFHTACRLQTAALAAAIVAIVFFIFSILAEVALARHHRKEKRFGPGPGNNYTSGYDTRGGLFSRLFRRKNRGDMANDSALPAHTTPDQYNNRQSYATETTAVGHDNANPYSGEYAKYENGYGYGARPPAHRYEDGTYDRV